METEGIEISFNEADLLPAEQEVVVQINMIDKELEEIAKKDQEAIEDTYRMQGAYTYGLPKEYETSLFQAQGGKCAVCKEEKDLQIEHDHKTMMVRALVCGSCNYYIGRYEKNPKNFHAKRHPELESLVKEYVEKHSSGQLSLKRYFTLFRTPPGKYSYERIWRKKNLIAEREKLFNDLAKSPRVSVEKPGVRHGARRKATTRSTGT